MVRSSPWFASALAIFAVGLTAGSARADFYRLTGQFQCLNNPTAVCTDMDPLTPPAVPKPEAPSTFKVKASAPKPAQPVAVDAVRDPASARPPIRDVRQPPHPRPPVNPVHEIAMQIKAGKLSTANLEHLRRLSKGGHGDATELLAWCTYLGIGVPRDPVTAYFLYGDAANQGVSHARSNQAAIYVSALTSSQRQHVLDIENNGVGRLAMR